MLDEREEQLVRELLKESRNIGAPSLLRRLFTLKVTGTQTIGTGVGVEIAVETLEDLQFAHYLPVVQSSSNVAIVDTFDGAGLIPAGTALSGIHFGILRRRQIGVSAASKKIDVKLYIVNTTGIARACDYQVFRFAGLGV